MKNSYDDSGILSGPRPVRSGLNANDPASRDRDSTRPLRGLWRVGGRMTPVNADRGKRPPSEGSERNSQRNLGDRHLGETGVDRLEVMVRGAAQRRGVCAING